jgi:hypothetical protein
MKKMLYMLETLIKEEDPTKNGANLLSKENVPSKE